MKQGKRKVWGGGGRRILKGLRVEVLWGYKGRKDYGGVKWELV